MSENEVYVACTCYQDGLTTEPPIPRSDIVFDRFGNIMRRGSQTPEDDPEEFWEWRDDHACQHYEMRLIEEIWHAPRWRDDQMIEKVLKTYPALCTILDGSNCCSQATVLASPELTGEALEQWESLFATRPGGSAQVVVDGKGLVVDRPHYDPDAPVDRFIGLSGYFDYCQRYARTSPPEDLIEIGVQGSDLVVRRYTDSQELLRASSLTQVVSSDPEVRSYRGVAPNQCMEWGNVGFTFTSLTDPETGASVEGYTRPVQYDFYNSYAGYKKLWTFPSTVHIVMKPLIWSDLCWPLGPLRAFLQASVDTGNPMVGYYNGGSLGY